MSGEQRVLSVNIGQPVSASHQGKEVRTGIFKSAVEGPVLLTKVNFVGDEQADLVHHGGPDKAVCVYPYEHYRFFEQKLGRDLPYGAFGENLTVHGLLETEVCIGDTFQIGEVVVQISQPRQPCFKLAVRYGVKELPVLIQNMGYTGFYFRVLQEGKVTAHDPVQRIKSSKHGITVSFANRIMHHEQDNEEALCQLLAVEELADSWRKTFAKRLGRRDNR